VIIDSVVPPHLASLGLNWTNAGVGMKNLFRACSQQPRCADRFTPGRTFAKLVRELEADPQTMKVKPALIPGDKPAPGAKRVKVVFDGGSFANYIINITGAGLGADVPRLLDEFARGHRRPLFASQGATGDLHAGELSYGLQYGVVCSEWVPFKGPKDVVKQGRKAFPGFPDSVLANAPQFPFRELDCPVWGVPKAPVSQRAVTHSDIPALVLAGGYDSLTSTRSAKYAASTLTNSTYVRIPGTGHVVLNTSPCAGEVAASFLAAPSAPDTGCVAGLEDPKFSS
jgi:pimeloyl-ACP methyl ester carboxylesterase